MLLYETVLPVVRPKYSLQFKLLSNLIEYMIIELLEALYHWYVCIPARKELNGIDFVAEMSAENILPGRSFRQMGSGDGFSVEYLTRTAVYEGWRVARC